MSAAWFCPSCQKHHAPHVETCPGSVDVRPIPGVNVWPSVVIPPQTMPHEWYPATTDVPWAPYWPQIISGSAPYRPSFDPDKVVVSQ